MSACHPEQFLYSRKTRKKHAVNRVGEGRYGQVSVGCTNATCKREIAVKKSLDDMSDEFRILKKAHRAAPENVPRAYAEFECKVGYIMYLEYIPSKTLASYRKITPRMFFEILLTIYRLNKAGVYHNDVHLHNILIEDSTHTPFITDFGLATTRPYVDERYDYHLFVNNVYTFLANSSIRSFIKKVIPKEYLGKTSPKVEKYRLRKGVSHSTLPTLKQFLSAFEKML
jgi:tRNA A-37 threonylcarbamoyl transferase component Bud32